MEFLLLSIAVTIDVKVTLGLGAFISMWWGMRRKRK